MPDLRPLGYRLLGRGFDYLLHLRPAEWPIVTVHLLTGSAMSVGMAGLAAPAHRGALLLGILAFVAGLNGGTLALNSAFDRDERDVAYLRRPPPPPPGLALFGILMMAAGFPVALRLPGDASAVYAVCGVLSVLYSVPPVRLKAVAGADWLVNMAGFGLLTPYVGWTLTGRGLTSPGWKVMAAFALLFGALYPLTQLYQLEEDHRRGDRTLAVALGPTRSLAVAVATAVAAFAGFAWAAATSGWGSAPGALARWIALAVAAAAWVVILRPWWRDRATMAAAEHQAAMHRALAAWAVTDMAVLFAWAR